MLKSTVPADREGKDTFEALGVCGGHLDEGLPLAIFQRSRRRLLFVVGPQPAIVIAHKQDETLCFAPFQVKATAPLRGSGRSGGCHE